MFFLFRFSTCHSVHNFPIYLGIYLFLDLFIPVLRFICLIDTLYDHKIRLVASGEKAYWELFKVRYYSVLFFFSIQLQSLKVSHSFLFWTIEFLCSVLLEDSNFLTIALFHLFLSCSNTLDSVAWLFDGICRLSI